MPIPTFTKMGPYPDFNAVVAKINTLVSELQNLMLSLDDANFRSITAKVIDVEQLSAISADLGEITAGIIRGIEIYGSYISTNENSYPRAELNITNNLVAAMQDPGHYMSMAAQGFGSVPALSWFALGTIVGFLNRSAGGTTLGTFNSEPLNLQGSSNIVLQAVSGNINLSPAGSLQIGGTNGVTGTFYVASAPNGPTTQQVTFTKGIRVS